MSNLAALGLGILSMVMLMLTHDSSHYVVAHVWFAAAYVARRIK